MKSKKDLLSILLQRFGNCEYLEVLDLNGMGIIITDNTQMRTVFTFEGLDLHCNLSNLTLVQPDLLPRLPFFIKIVEFLINDKDYKYRIKLSDNDIRFTTDLEPVVSVSDKKVLYNIEDVIYLLPYFKDITDVKVKLSL